MDQKVIETESSRGHTDMQGIKEWNNAFDRTPLTHCGRVTQICVFNTVKLGTSASYP